MSIVGTGYEFTVVHLGVDRVVYPLNYRTCSIISEEQEDLIFLRKKFNGELIFLNQENQDDFDYFFTIDRDRNLRCNEITFNVYYNSELCFKGYFSVNKGKFDVDACKFSVTPEPDDKYRLIFDKWKVEYNILEKVGAVYTIPEVTVKSTNPLVSDYTRCRNLLDVLEFLAQKLIPGATIQSLFFTDATDYVTLQPNNNLKTVIAQKSDILTPASSEPASKGMISFSTMMDILRIMYNVWWDYDEDLNQFNIEHISFFGSTSIYDTREDTLAKGTKKYSYKSESIPKQETFEMMESLFEDFVGKPIRYEGSCVTVLDENSEKKYTIPVSTDITWLEGGGNNSASPEGFVILVAEDIAGNWTVKTDTGFISLSSLANAHLSWANLLLNYHRHNRLLKNGYINDINQEFISTKRLTQQNEFSIENCGCVFDSDVVFKTELGDDVLGGEYGYPSSIEIMFDGKTKLNLNYGEPENENEGVFDPEIVLYGAFPEHYDNNDLCGLEQSVYDPFPVAYINNSTQEMFRDAAGTIKVNLTGNPQKYWNVGIVYTDPFFDPLVPDYVAYIGWYELDANSVLIGYFEC